MNITVFDGLSFFMVEKYEYEHKNTCDFSNCPRPHFCMGYILEGEGAFNEIGENNTIIVKKGDIIFVPITSRYVSSWKGDSKISYISFHFSFEGVNNLNDGSTMKVQKIHLEDTENIKSMFVEAFENTNGGVSQRLKTLANFYNILSMAEQKIVKTKNDNSFKKIVNAVKYINMNSEKPVNVKELADMCNMSESNFYPCFRNCMKMSPIEYKNLISINRAMKLMIAEPDMSVEEISTVVGFCTSAYFRRQFKKITGKTPKEYKKNALEI